MFEDKIGKTTLEIISDAKNFNSWMYDTISPYIHGKVLEIGSGIGNISKFVLNDNHELMVSDLRLEYCELLKSKFAEKPNFLGAHQLNLTHPEFKTEYSQHLGMYNTVFALNVVEHIKNDGLALQNCKTLLKPQGTLIILVPAYQNLMNKFDENLGHFRRYTRTSLSEKLINNDFSIVASQYFNFIGIFGWYGSGKLLKRNQIPAGQMKIYNKLVPIFKIIDKATFKKIGLSVIVVGKK